MDTMDALYLARILRTAAFIDQSRGLGLFKTIKEKLRTLKELCEELKEKFEYHENRAGFEHEVVITDDPLMGPFKLPDTPGFYWKPGSLPKWEKRPNADYFAAEEILQLAEELKCSWAERARNEFNKKYSNMGEIALPLS